MRGVEGGGGGRRGGGTTGGGGDGGGGDGGGGRRGTGQTYAADGVRAGVEQEMQTSARLRVDDAEIRLGALEVLRNAEEE